MPRIQVKDQPYQRTELVNLLITELGRDGGNGQPLIVENRIGSSNNLRVVVVWERWDEVPAIDRAGIIQEAYEKFNPDIAARIMIAMGVTLDEGMELRLLPYAVVLIPSEGFNEKKPELVAAMREEGAVLTRRGWQLRFPNEDVAKQALERLSKKIPGNFWALQRDVSADND